VSALYRQLAEEHATLIRASARDALTRVYNRSYFDEQFRQAFERAARSGEPLSLIMIDVDHFKHYNDAFGHLHGDACLGAVAGALAGTLRQPGGFVARYGGEEFALVLPDTLSPVLTRELVYTGITRARSFLTIASAGGTAIVERAVEAQVQRASGLSAGFDFQ